MDKKEIRKQLEKELAACDIKDANNIDSSDNLEKAVELFVQLGDDSKDYLFKNDCKILRWRYGMSPVNDKDLIKDLDILRNQLEKIEQSNDNFEEECDKLLGMMSVISTDIEDADFVDIPIEDEFLQMYDCNKDFNENKKEACDRLRYVLSRFDNAIKEQDKNLLYTYNMIYILWGLSHFGCVSIQFNEMNKKEPVE